MQENMNDWMHCFRDDYLEEDFLSTEYGEDPLQEAEELVRYEVALGNHSGWGFLCFLLFGFSFSQVVIGNITNMNYKVEVREIKQWNFLIRADNEIIACQKALDEITSGELPHESWFEDPVADPVPKTK